MSSESAAPNARQAKARRRNSPKTNGAAGSSNGLDALANGGSDPAGSPVTQDVQPDTVMSSSAVLQSWGRYPKLAARSTRSILWRDEIPRLDGLDGSVLPYGLGRSYGDSCLNQDGVLLDASGLRRLIAFNETTGVLRCEAGVTLADILDQFVPRGWFLPTTPGTKYVTVGGAIANDVHGKNHHRAGTFGRHVLQLELVRSSGERLLCSPTENADLFRATIGGLGLTGLITWAEVRLKPVPGPYIAMESIKFRSLDEFFEVSRDSDELFEYTMSWVDCLATGKDLGRGLFLRGNHSWQKQIPGRPGYRKQRFNLPVNLPSFALNPLTVRAFNTLLYNKQLARAVQTTTPYDPFFYPLDSIGNWNRLYGSQGFLQHQCVIPHDASKQGLHLMLETISASGQGSFLAVLKTFGDLPSPGMMSFPRPGATLALDFPMKGRSTLELLDRLDSIVLDHGGAVYPAKDARMSPDCFEASFPNWRDFAGFVDEKFSSSFWRRVTQPGKVTA